ncbi:MAG: RNA pseudouridine synthase [Zetaproteobacteria bacterium CG2_30_46_52]|nr:MAG: RNA pseudouridine synthase [Zetaproteobacteria bacterium CG2_30_46_52]
MTYFPITPKADDIPNVFPTPFSDTPHPLAIQASQMLQARLSENKDFDRDFFTPDHGKMFGVLVVQDQQARLGFLSAFSGMMNGQWFAGGFMPPIFDVEAQTHFLTSGKSQLQDMAKTLEVLESSKQRYVLAQSIVDLKKQRDAVLTALKQRHKAEKQARDAQRFDILVMDDAQEQQSQLRALALQSQHNKREATNAASAWKERIEALAIELEASDIQISQLKNSRSKLSQDLHAQVFASYTLYNFKGEQKTITDFFIESTPPAGAGDCAGPKLIHYAQTHALKPIAMAEFWWGASPAAGVRHHQQFYPACRGKCRPILPFMLEGLDVEPEPYYGLEIDQDEPKIIYEDDVLIVINKPSGLMSVPGKLIKDCVFNRLMAAHPECPELRLVHRLDMSTSGILLVAKNLKINKLLQKQFIQRTVDKRYEAILSKPLDADEGNIDLPMRVDFDDRPRQLVCYEYGKPAKTHWEVITRDERTTRVYFYPHTGRTHQLRLHASHRDGLNAAIVGDDLYGQAGERLMLHAQRLSFNHPVTRERLTFEVPAPF